MARYLSYMNLHAGRPDKYKRYRERKKAAGLKQVRVWALDPEAPGFRERLESDQARIRDSEDERATISFIETMMSEDLAQDDASDIY
ncbi:antitoxin MazE-like protein [Brevundimonas sp. SL130]|uniref:antitoxin MazE-like protein n=1 Tax=Brevundimonas sp. SL130 TaxID=2995143 RepID=UPI00226D321B|nr:antitoxin MazE-like protein [Brevundimonas sp. SL130]WAC60996.1 DUF3018 family protein [Brevundimonas sp. SL130]